MRSRVARFAMRRKGTVATALILLLALSGTAIAGTGRGADLELGVVNTVNGYLTSLKGSFSGNMFQVTNTGTGRGIGISVAAGKAPIYVNASAGKAINLNADKLDGRSSAAFQRAVTGACPSGSSIGDVNADGSVICNAGVPGVSFSSGSGLLPTGTMQFLAAPATVSVSAGQAVAVTSDKQLGSTVGAANLRLYICYLSAVPGSLITTVGAGSWNYAVAAGTRQSFGLSAAFALPAGTYSVGLCGHTSDSNTNWNLHEFSYTTALVVRPAGSGIMTQGSSRR